MNKGNELSERTLKFKNMNRSVVKSLKATRNTSYEEYLTAMKRVHRESLIRDVFSGEMLSPRERYRNRESLKQAMMDVEGSEGTVQQATRISIIASMVPDEIISKHFDHSIRSYKTALMFIDVSGFTELCESYTKAGRGGPSRLTQVLNSYIGAMVQEILTHNGDILKFSGDAFLCMWKKTSMFTMQDVVHTAIDCGLIIQRNYGTHVTDFGVVLKVKVAISAGTSHFAIIGGGNIAQCHYVIVGQPVWDVKMAEYVSTAGDVLTSASAWMYVNEAEYFTQPCGDGRHTKVLGVGATWKRVGKLDCTLGINKGYESFLRNLRSDDDPLNEINYREYVLRPSVVAAMRSKWWPSLRRFMVTPVIRAVDNDEPMDFLTEVRRVVVVFLNIITKSVTENKLIEIVNNVYKYVCSVSSESGGLVNKVSMFDKDMMFLVVFGLRGLKDKDEVQKALLCAFEIKRNLNDANITSVSIGVTSGTTYCGVVGHVLRREYTVIGPTVNKAARLMMAYNNKVTCDKETFLRSKLEQEFFKLMEEVPLKGIAKPGPIYEFNKTGWLEHPCCWRHPMLGRDEEIRKYKTILQNVLQQQHQFTRYKDHKYAIAITGPKMVGKTRLMEECLNETPKFLHIEKITLNQNDRAEYGLIRTLLAKPFKRCDARAKRENYENRIRSSVNITQITPTQLYAINTIFDCFFPLPEKFQYSGDILVEDGVKKIVKDICKNIFSSLWVMAVEEAHYIDDESWPILLILLEIKCIFLIMTVAEEYNMTPTARNCLSNHMIVTMHLSGIDRWYHAALACQLLDVQAIPPDLEKIIESASGGMPGWVQNFVISLVQSGELSVVTVSRNEALASGAVMPSKVMLQRDIDLNTFTEDHLNVDSANSLILTESLYTNQDNVTVQMAVLSESYNFDDMKIDMTMDAIILKTYDSLTPFEKMLLKCSSVLGDVFSRKLLQHLLQEDSSRKVARAVAKLFMIRVLECEGGDFTRDTSMVLIHPTPMVSTVKPPYCACIGIRPPPDCKDLPMYAFCGYMKFKHSLFRTTTYDLLTECQKHDMHGRALLYLERYARRCVTCGTGSFIKLLGHTSNDGLKLESEEMKRTRKLIQALSAEATVPGKHYESPFLDLNTSEPLTNYPREYLYNTYDDSREDIRSLNQSKKTTKRMRSFSSLEPANCECLSILLTVYCQVIDHCRGAGAYEKLFEAYIEYAQLSVVNLNIPQAIRLLFEAEGFVMSEQFSKMSLSKVKWIKDFALARIFSLRGTCMFESGDFIEARKQLMHAMKLFQDPFPTSKHSVRLRNIQALFHQMMAFYVVPKLYVGIDSGLVGRFYEEIANTLNRLYRLFIECKELENASLAAKWCLIYALRTDSDFRLLCLAYGNMIGIYRQKRIFSMCTKLGKKSMQLCYRKCGQIDVTEVQAVCYLYTNIFLFYVDFGKKSESLEFGLSVMHMMSSLTDLTTRQMLVLWMLKLLLYDMRIKQMVDIMREFFYMTDQYDLSSETWYYFYAMVIMLDTGYCVETYGSSERFYIKKGDSIIRSKTPEAAWNYFVCMWLVTIRVGEWERSILWEDKIKQILSMKFRHYEFNTLLYVRLIEGLLILLVKEMDNRNIKKIRSLEKTVTTLFKEMTQIFYHTVRYRPRYFLLIAYYNFMRGKKARGYRLLNKAAELAKQLEHGTLLIWIRHTRNHWMGTLNPMLENYWTEHVEENNLLDYRDFDLDKGRQIIPYTLPLPRDFDRS